VTVAGPNSAAGGSITASISGQGYADFHVPSLTLQPGAFEVTTAVVHQGHVYDYAERAFDLRVRGGGTGEPGLVLLAGSWSASRPAADASRAGANRA
jgi:ABC-2 type transport system ATP-binding protein/lipopolysaccharide transport system ATP-binding protein